MHPEPDQDLRALKTRVERVLPDISPNVGEVLRRTVSLLGPHGAESVPPELMYALLCLHSPALQAVSEKSESYSFRGPIEDHERKKVFTLILRLVHILLVVEEEHLLVLGRILSICEFDLTLPWEVRVRAAGSLAQFIARVKTDTNLNL